MTPKGELLQKESELKKYRNEFMKKFKGIIAITVAVSSPLPFLLIGLIELSPKTETFLYIGIFNILILVYAIIVLGLIYSDRSALKKIGISK